MNKFKNIALKIAASAAALGWPAFNALAQTAAIENVVPRTDITSVDTFKTQIEVIINSLVGIISIIAAIMLVYGAYLYVTAGADEDNAKKGKTVLVYAIIGIIVAVLVYAIVNVAQGLIGG